MSKSTKVNIRQVAAHCGLSPATVSRVLNRNPSVDPDLAQRVLASAEALGYHGRNEHTGQRNIVFIAPYLGSTYYSDVADGVIDGVWGSEFNIITMVSKFDEERELECLRRACNPDTAGVIPISDRNPLDAVPELRSIPMVIVGPRHVSDELTHIHLNNEEAGYVTTRYLLLLGHRNIAFITSFWRKRISSYQEFMEEYHSPIRGRFSTYDRYDGYCRALREAGLTPDPKLIAFGEFSYESGYQCARQLLAGSRSFDAVIAPNDRSGAGVLKLLVEQGFHVPEQVSIACLNSSLIAQVVSPSLTTMSAANHEMGMAAVEQLLHLIRGEPARNVEIESKLLIKNSTQVAAP